MKKGINISSVDGKRVVKGLGYYPPKKVSDLRELIKGCVIKYNNLVGFKFKNKEGKIIFRTYNQFDGDIDSLGTALLSLGLKNSRISIISENRYEWGVCFFSIINGTGIGVPLDKYLPINEVENLIYRGEVEAIFYSPAYHEMMLNMASGDRRIQYYICMEQISETPDSRFLNLADLILKGRELLDNGDSSFIDAEIKKDDMSILLFTSGTTSLSKGVMLSHANIAANVTSITTVINIGPADVHLSLLPLHHTFENTIGLMAMVHCGACISYCDGIKHIAENLQEYDVSLLVAVPAIFEVMYRKMWEGIRKSGKESLFKILIKVSDGLRAIGIDIRRKLFKSVFKQLGPKLRLAVSGAAPIDPEVVIGFERIGLIILQGYGLTEASPVIAANNDFVNKPGTIGFPLPDIEVSINSPDENGMGEILARGGNIMLGYYKDTEATSEVIDKDGWLHTGDLGIIDEEGFITITGRAKSMIVFTNGKKAFPEEYEVLLNNIPGVKDSYVWGYKTIDDNVQVCAKLVLDNEKLLGEKGELPSEEELSNIFDPQIKRINKTLPQYKIIRYFIMTNEELIKTTTLKIKRPVELERINLILEKKGLDMRKASGKMF